MTVDPFERHVRGAVLSVCTPDPPPSDVRKALADLADAAHAVVGPGSWFAFALADVGQHRCCRVYLARTMARDGHGLDWNQAIHTAVADLAEVVAKVPLPYPFKQRHALAQARFWSAVVQVHALTGAP